MYNLQILNYLLNLIINIKQTFITLFIVDDDHMTVCVHDSFKIVYFLFSTTISHNETQ